MRLRKSSLTTMLILLVLLVYGIVTVAVLQPKIEEAQLEAAKLSEENASLANENEKVKEDIRALGSDPSVIDIARERLNYVFENEIIYLEDDR